MLVHKIVFQTTLKTVTGNNICTNCGVRPHAGYLMIYVGQKRNWMPGFPTCLTCLHKSMDEIYSRHQREREEGNYKQRQPQPLDVSEAALARFVPVRRIGPRS
jgi:hypothetical protein